MAPAPSALIVRPSSWLKKKEAGRLGREHLRAGVLHADDGRAARARLRQDAAGVTGDHPDYWREYRTNFRPSRYVAVPWSTGVEALP